MVNQIVSDTMSRIGSEPSVDLDLCSAEGRAPTPGIGHLKALVDQLPVGVFVAREGRLLYLNRALADLFGYEEQEMLSAIGSADLAAPDDLEEMGQQVANRVFGRLEAAPCTVRCSRRDGSRFDARVQVLRIWFAGAEADLVTLHDISDTRVALEDATELVNTTEALRLSQTMLDRAPVLILSADEEGNISYVNDAACRTLGYSAEAFQAMRIFEIAPHRRADTWAATVTALKQLGSKTFESDWRSASGRIIPVEISATHMLYDGRGYVVIYGSDISMRREAEQQALRLAHFDDVTGLPNRTLLQDRLRSAASQSLRDGRSITVLAIEIGQLRTVNETMGQAAGDLLLKTLTQRMSIGLRGSDTMAHLGGGEFAVLIARESDVGEETALPQARAIVEVLSAPVMIQGTEIYVTCTIGATIFPQDGNQPEHILRQAQAALRIAHSQGTNQIGFYTPEANARVSTRLAMEASLRRAIDHGDLQLHFQPQIDLSSGHIIGVEALIRWEHPELGMLDPADFLPVAEETGLTLALGDWVLRTACMTSVAWQCMGLPPIRMAVNLSARQLQQPDIARRIQSILMETGLSASHLGIEITESMLVENVDHVAQTLKALKTIGVEIALDDFGTGYSSLSHLRRLPIDMIKVDGSFVHDVTAAPEDVSITRAIITMAHSLQIKVMAEGVENAGQLALLVANHCDQMQGYFFSPAVDAEAVEAMLLARRQLPQESLGRKARTRTLLLVDDEDNIVASLKRLLRRDGYHIVTANSGAQGLQRLAENEVDVIISDQRMPGMTGVEFLRRAKELYPETVRLVLSGYTELQSITDAINEGAIYKFLTKPWDDERVRAHIAEAFRHKEMADENERLDQEVQQANRELAEVNGKLQRLLETQREQMHRDETSLVIAREVLENIPAPVIGTDMEGTVAFLNTDAEALFADSAPPLGRHVEDAFDANLLEVWQASDGRYHRVFIVEHPYQAVCRPMTGESGSRGKLMVLTPDAAGAPV